MIIRSFGVCKYEICQNKAVQIWKCFQRKEKAHYFFKNGCIIKFSRFFQKLHKIVDFPLKFHLNNCNCNICRKSFNCVSLLNSHKLNSGHILVGCQRETLCFQFVMFSFDLVALVLDLQATQTWHSSICSIVVLLVSIKCSLQGFVNLMPRAILFL